MDNNNPKMRSMFGGESTGGFFGLPVTTPGDVGNADIVVMGVGGVTPYASVGPYCQNAPDAIRGAFGWPGVLDHHDFDLGGTILVNHTRPMTGAIYPMMMKIMLLTVKRSMTL